MTKWALILVFHVYSGERPTVVDMWTKETCYRARDEMIALRSSKASTYLVAAVCVER